MYKTEEHLADRRCHAAPKRSDGPLARRQTDGPTWTAPGVSVRLLAAHEHHEHVAVLSVRGEIDLATAPMLREALSAVLEDHSGAAIVDLSEVPFMDSTGVHVLFDTLWRLEPQNRRLAIVCHEQGQVHRLLALVGLTVYRSRQSAAIGGDDVLRSESGNNSWPSDGWTPTHGLLSARHTAQTLTGAAPATDHRTRSMVSASDDARDAPGGPSHGTRPAIQ